MSLHPPSQRCTKENANGLSLQYFPKAPTYRTTTADDLQRAADELYGQAL
jgi:IS30 family transposase